MNKLKYYQKSEEFMLDIEQLFHKNLDLNEDNSLTECVVLTSFVCKERPLLNYLFKSKIPCTIFKEPRGKHNDPIQEYKHCRIIIPPNNLGFGCYHPKIMLIKFADSLRVVISSANLIELDWQELGQVIWFQDFPLNTENEEQTNDFLETLSSFMELSYNDTHREALRGISGSRFFDKVLPEETSDIKFHHLLRGELNLSAYNYNSAAVDLISSVNGQILGKDKTKFGMYRLADLISKSEYKPNANSEIIYQCTSYGNLSKDYLHKFVDTIVGNVDEHGEAAAESVRPELKLIYPTQEYVDKVMEKNGKLHSNIVFLP